MHLIASLTPERLTGCSYYAWTDPEPTGRNGNRAGDFVGRASGQDASVQYATGMTRDHRIVAIVLAAVVWCTAPAAGNVSTAPGQEEERTEQLEQLRQRLEEARTRLDLTDAQVEQVRPILRAELEALQGVLQEHGIDIRDRSGGANRLRFRQLRRLQRDLNAVREQTLEDLDEVLTDEQLETYREIQEENRQAMRERLRQRR